MDALDRMMKGDCEKIGHDWVKEKGKPGPVCFRCGVRPLAKRYANKDINKPAQSNLEESHPHG